MKVVVQRSKYSCVTVDGKLINEINDGLVLLVGFTHTDTEKEIDYMINKIMNQPEDRCRWRSTQPRTR